MDAISTEMLAFLCRSLSNAIGMPVRIYREGSCAAFYSVYRLSPDPAALQLDRLLNTPQPTGVISTALSQYYGYFTLSGGERMIVGPSRAENSDPRLMQEQLFLLGVAPEDWEEYLRCLGCLPVYSMERMSWLISFLSTVSRRQMTSVADLFQNQPPEDHRETVQRNYSHYDIEAATPDGVLLDNGYRFEKLILTFIEQGQPERVRELLDAPPSLLTGQLSQDTLRQAKNLGVCAATIASRAAIAGGVDSRTAFRMSDLYIQQIELLRDVASVDRLRGDVFVDFAREVQRVRYNVRPEIQGDRSSLFVQCSDYVAQNIYTPIRAQEMADALGYTRSYLCSRFRDLAGMTLSQYILQEKIFEAQRLLRFSDQSLSQLSALLAFSSQSHFQNVFKKQTGETPAQYRKRMR